jgi:hypothetical protein
MMNEIDLALDSLAFDTQRKAEWLRQAFANVGRRYEVSDVVRMQSGKSEFRFTVREMHAGMCRQFADGDSFMVTVTGERNVAA